MTTAIRKLTTAVNDKKWNNANSDYDTGDSNMKNSELRANLKVDNCDEEYDTKYEHDKNEKNEKN